MARSSIEALSSLIRYPAADRNKAPILEVLQKIYASEPTVKSVLEIATGQHISHFASAFPSIQFQPSDVDSQLFGNINLFRRHLNLPNLLEPILLDLTTPVDHWPLPPASVDAIYCANVLHISSWDCSLGLLHGSSRVLRPGGLLIIYGPFAVNGVLSPESNIQFNASLCSRNTAWGIRDVQDLRNLGKELNLKWVQSFEMPANNKMLLFKKKVE